MIPILPTRTKVLFPNIVIQLSISLPSSIALVSSLNKDVKDSKDSFIGIVPFKENSNDLFDYGALAKVIQIVKTNKGSVRFIITLEGIARFKIKSILQSEPFYSALVIIYQEPEVDSSDSRLQALIVSLRTTATSLSSMLAALQLPPNVIAELEKMIQTCTPAQLIDLFMSMIDLSFNEKLEMLSLFDITRRCERALDFLHRQFQVLKISQKLQSSIENNLGQKQREFLLRQQLDAIKKELGEADSDSDEMSDIAKKLENAKLPDSVSSMAEKELKRLSRMNPSQSEYQVQLTYLQVLSELPWSVSTENILDVNTASFILDQDHYGLEKVKKRILEYIAVCQLNNELKGPILCLCGPPGVGKTSLGKSIAKALNRPFYRMSLGGVHDEAQIRGHRRTYVGAMPGMIIQAFRKISYNNPVFLLDEVDKLGSNGRSDPTSAFLEVLDPEQNSSFVDNYLNVGFDLSKTLFIATANDVQAIPRALLDRMELIEIPGYTTFEKLDIANRHLIPKQLTLHGLGKRNIDFSQDIILSMITGYTNEAGVRHLERVIGGICRFLALEYARNASLSHGIDASLLEASLGPRKYQLEKTYASDIVGVATGLAWTSVGGKVLYVESTKMPGSGKLIVTGNLGQVMKESTTLALSWIKSHSRELNLDLKLFTDFEFHVHFPSGATPKDGPSAGITILISLVSLLTNQPIKKQVAMTGEISLLGNVLPVGGIRDKILAGYAIGIREFMIPFDNVADLKEISPQILDNLQMNPVKTIFSALDHCFPLVPLNPSSKL